MSIETQVAFKGLIELYGHMLGHPEAVPFAETDAVLATTKALAARLGRVEWPVATPEVPPATAENTREV